MLLYLIFAIIIPSILCDDKLIHVQAIWRHGERNPWTLYRGDLNNVSAFPDGLGKLTKNGIQQLYTLGQQFQKRYIKGLQLLSPDYVNSEVSARSTDYDRVITSAMAFFSGLYSNEEDHILIPAPIHSMPIPDDFLNTLTLECPRKTQLWKMVDKSQVILSMLNNSHELLEEVSNQAQVPLSFYKIYDIFDAGMVEESFGLPVPSWLSQYFPEWKPILSKYVSALWGLSSFPNDSFSMDLQQELTKISGGSTLAEIVGRWEQKIKCLNVDDKNCLNIKDQKFYGYSGHDLTEIGLFAALGFTDFPTENQTWPDLASVTVLELWHKEDSNNEILTQTNQYDFYYVKIYYYQNNSVDRPKYIGDLLPECHGKGCPLKYFIKRAELLRPKPDLQSYCNQPIASATIKLNCSFAILLIVLVMFLDK